MITNAPLEVLLNTLLTANRRRIYKLRGGLQLIGYPPDDEHPNRRIIALRQGVPPSDRELDIVRRYIIGILDRHALATVSEFYNLPPQQGYHAAQVEVNIPASHGTKTETDTSRQTPDH